MPTKLVFGLAALAWGAALPAWGQGIAGDQDRRFVQSAVAASQEEIDAGRIAETRSTDPAIREFGRWMVADHTLLNEMLAHQLGQNTLPPASSPDAQAKLNALHGHSWSDAAYVGAQVDDHRRAIALFEQEQREGQNESLKSFSRMALPVLRAHLDEAEDLQSRAVAQMQPGAQVSIPSPAPANLSQTTASTAQSPAVKQMNREELQRVEKEGK